MIPRDTCLLRYARVHSFDTPAPDLEWLAGEEASELRRIGDARRRREWIAGRILGRALLHDALSLGEAPSLQILSRDGRGLGTSPRVMVEGRTLDVQLSLSHSSRGAMAALVTDRRIPLGVDLCDHRSITPGLQRAWFSPVEQDWVGGDALRAATIWAVKEAVYKAVASGAPWNPRQVEVLPRSAGQLECRFQDTYVSSTQLRVWQLDGHVAALVCQSLGFEMDVTRVDVSELLNLGAVTLCS